MILPNVQINNSLLLTAILCCLPIGLVLAVIHRKRKEQRQCSCSPFNELVRRPAGETLRNNLETLDEKINYVTMWMLLFPMLMMYFLISQHSQNWVVPLLSFAFVTSSSAICGRRLYKLLATRSNYRLGYEGERFVGEELSRLHVLGFEVYHDVPFDGFNIDHVLVGTRGVFIVETKTRRKPMEERGNKFYRVQFNGQCLQWPKGTDYHGINQAKNNAKTLSAWLGSVTGENLFVTPILALPGWLVERKIATEAIYVLNPKEIYQICASYPPKLSQPEIRRICHQLDQKCRIAVS